MDVVVKTLTVHEVRDFVDRRGAQLVNVLPVADYRDQHIAGSISLPLTELSRQTANERLDRDKPVIVYCYDTQ